VHHTWIVIWLSLKNFVMKFIGGSLAVPEGDRKWYSIILWWELRRIPYNIIVGGFGLLCLMLFLVFNELPPPATFEEQDWEPFSVLIFGFMANVFYTGGWMTELLILAVSPTKAKHFAPSAFCAGLLFSLFLCCLPPFANACHWLHRVFTR
jgi:hypothetical protein